MAQPQPFDPGYDYSKDRPIEERLLDGHDPAQWHEGDPLCVVEEYQALCKEAAGEIRALRLHVKTLNRRVDDLLTDIANLTGDEE